MKKLVKRNIPKMDTVQCYYSCDIQCLSCVCTYEAARDDTRINRHNTKDYSK